MIDHVLGRPSVRFRKYQVFAVVFIWSAYLLKGNRHGPPGTRRISAFLSNRLTTFQTVVISLLYLYIARNFGKLVGLECPEPLANLYSRSYFRATWVTTALDAGFWSAMHIRRKWLRDFCSVLFSAWYLVCAEQADEKVRKVRSVLTVDHLRVAWNKTTTPYLGALARLQRPRFMRYPPRAIRIPRPEGSAYTEPVHGWLYFDGPLSALKKHTKVILHIPGGGFVAMSPRTHDDALFAWAGKTGLPVLSLDYHKAPEFPYPYALNECYDVYTTLFASSGRCIGLSGEHKPRVVIAGDSAGGNLATGLVLMILQSGSTDTRRWHGEAELPPPEGLVLVYPALDFNIGNWMTDEQMAVIRDRKSRKTNERVLSRKRSDYHRRAPQTPIASDDEDDGEKSPPTPPRSHSKHKGKHHSNGDTDRIETITTLHKAPTNTVDPVPPPNAALPKTRLFTSSLISYVSDRVLTPEMMRAMIILYIGPHNRPDFSTDYLLSPVLAPDALLARFPPTYFFTGERDPLVDDTVIMAGRIRQAKESRRKERHELGLLSTKRDRAAFADAGPDDAPVDVTLVEGVSHGFLQFAQLLPESWGYIDRVRGWLERCFDARDYALKRQARRQRHAAMMAQAQAQARRMPAGVSVSVSGPGSADAKPRHHRRTGTQSSAVSDDDQPLEMSSKLRLTKTATNGSVSTPGVTPGAPDLEDDEDEDDDEGDFASVPSTPGAGLTRNGKSLVSLASEDDLLGRRMRGLVGSLTRREDV